MKAHLFNLCDESASYLPKHGKSSFVRACILEIGRRQGKSKGEPVAVAVPPAVGEPVAVEPVAVEPVAVEPAIWERSGVRLKTIFPAGFNYSSLLFRRDERGYSICINPPPWPEALPLNMNQANAWGKYVDAWTFADPFPGPHEWAAMGEPEKPLPGHRRAVVVPAVEPLPVIVEPDVVPEVPANPPLQGGGMSCNVLDEI
jgi:hypothetical protein